MAQKVQFDTDEAIPTVFLHSISTLAVKFPAHDLRVTDDPGNIKVYVGEYYQETHRYWITEDGLLANALIEKDTTDEGDWQAVSWHEAHDELIKGPND